MKMSDLVSKTTKNINQDDPSRNAQLLIRAGFVDRLMAGAYSYQPLGVRVLTKIEDIIREEMNSIGGQEILMPALQPRQIWEQTERWDKVDVLFKLKGAGDRDFALGPTHEEVVTPLIGQYIQSYRDLPKLVYQIQTKFRNEARAKSGLLRGREFRMKDLYSFHATQQSLDEFYEKSIDAYNKIYKRCGLGDITLLTYASGGIFSKYSHEFQTITPYGEDIVYRIPNTDIAINKEVIDDRSVLEDLIPNYKDGDENALEELKAIEVGNIFKLGDRFSNAFKHFYSDSDGKEQSIVMGCYGIGSSRVMGTVAECLSDENGLYWPDEIAPYKIHLISLCNNEADISKCEEIYSKLQQQKIGVLYDDRPNVRAGEKFSDADLIGVPHRATISAKTLKENCLEYKHRKASSSDLMSLEQLISKLSE